MKKNICKVMLFGIVLIGLVLSLPVKAEALSPKLMWQKKLNFEVTELAFAKQTGDVILSGKDARQIILLDKDGNERFHWGPRVDRDTDEVGITTDGKYFFYTSRWTEDFIKKMNKKSNDTRLHYVQRNGKELWSKPVDKPWMTTHLSPDGKYIAFAGIVSEGSGLELWDTQTWNKTFRYDVIGRDNYSLPANDFVFSPDSRYMVADFEGHIKLIDLAGKVMFSTRVGAMVITSVAKDANYIATGETGRKYGSTILDKQGAVVLQGKFKDYTLVSEDGNIGVVWGEDGIKAYSLPDKKLIGTFPIRRRDGQDLYIPIAISANGRTLVATGSRINSSSIDGKNLFIIDTLENTIWEDSIPSPQFQSTYLTTDGKYLLFISGGASAGIKSNLLFYQVY